MLQRIVRTVCTVTLGYSLAILPALCSADDKDTKPAKTPAPKAPNWSSYTTVGDVVGEIVSADEKRLTLRVTWYVPQVQGGGGGGNRRPQLSQNNRNFRNPYSRGSSQPRVNIKEQHHDYDLDFVPESLVRTKIIPPKYDDKGKRVTHTQKEIDELRTPVGVTGYTASAEDLTPGTIAEVILIRDKAIPASKATEGDLRVKYAIILGKDPNPPKGIGDNKADDKKGKKKN